MGWVKLDDGFWLSEKMEGVSDKAFRLYVRALSYSGQNRTDGMISRSALRRLDSVAKTANELVSAGLWEPNGDGWQIHDYLYWNPQRNTREALSEAGKRGAAKRWGTSDEDSPGYSQGHKGGHSQGHIAPPLGSVHSKDPTKTLPDEDPTRPDPNGRGHLSSEQNDALQTVLAEIPRKFQDEQTEIALRQVVTDWTPADVLGALRDCQRGRTIPWPNELRKRLPVLSKSPVLSSNGTPAVPGRSTKEPGYRGPDMDALMGRKP